MLSLSDNIQQTDFDAKKKADRDPPGVSNSKRRPQSALRPKALRPKDAARAQALRSQLLFSAVPRARARAFERERERERPAGQ